MNDRKENIDDLDGNKIFAYGLPNNVICIKQLLTVNEQNDLIHLSHDLYPSNILEVSPFPQHTPWIYYNWPSKFMEKEDAELVIKNDKDKEKEMQLLLDLGAVLGKMIIHIAETARKQKEQKDNPTPQHIKAQHEKRARAKASEQGSK